MLPCTMNKAFSSVHLIKSNHSNIQKTIIIKKSPYRNRETFLNTLSPSRVTRYKNHIQILVRVNCNIFV